MSVREDCLNNVAVILPSLDPDKKFSGVVRELLEAGFRHIIIVDDGSCEEKQHWFQEAAANPECSVIHHGVNKGKGRALKTAFQFVADNMPGIKGVVTIDGDGQHLTKDIIACSEKMLELGDSVVLGTRDFDLPGVPPRSVAGNKFTSRMFRLVFGIRLSDTQTGLRAIPASQLGKIASVEGERFEYETNMLLYMKRWGIPWYEQSIETVYDPEDYSSHYNAFKDSWRIFKVMFRFLTTASGFRYAVSGLLSWLLDNSLFLLMLTVAGVQSFASAAQVIARVISSLFNFNMNKLYAFRSRENYWKAMLKYYCVCLPQTFISVVCVRALVSALSVSAPIAATGIKVVIEFVLLIVSYFVQKLWVFREK